MLDRSLRIALGVAAVLLLWPLRDVRQLAISAIIGNDATPARGHPLPAGTGAGLSSTPSVRVVLIDGAGASTAATMPAWNQVCARGLDLAVDVGFPTVSLPVELALWSGRTQQQTGVLFHSTGKPVAPPAIGIPAQIPDSIAVAESHPYIVHSLGFAHTLPPTPNKTLPDGWATQWVEQAKAAIASPARLVFIHILRVDTAGHLHGKRSQQWRDAAASSDRIVGDLIATAPDARWFVLADHDHIATGGHGGEARAIRIVRGCIAGPGVGVGHGGPVAMVDISRALADSLAVTLAADAPGRPLAAALSAPVSDDDMLPPLARGRVLVALLLLALGIAATAWGANRRVLAGPWWWPVALIALCALETTPSLSTPMIYKKEGLTMANAFAPGLAVLAIAMTFGARRDWRRALVAQLALPIAATIAVWIVTGASSLWFGARVCPVVPLYTGWLPPLTMMAATASAVAGLVVLASAVLPGSGPSTPPETNRTGPVVP
jgi:Type I phosphodiesterase / nucleotide pyrophosphatase